MTQTEVPSIDEIYCALLRMPDSMVLTPETWRQYAPESLWAGMLLRSSMLTTGVPGDGPAWDAFARGQLVEHVRSVIGLWSTELLFAPLDAETIVSLTASPAFARNAMYWTALLHACVTAPDSPPLQALAATPPQHFVLPDFLIAWQERCAELAVHQTHARPQPPRASRGHRTRTGPCR